MSTYSTGDIRNVLLCGHGSSGKSTLAFDTVLPDEPSAPPVAA